MGASLLHHFLFGLRVQMSFYSPVADFTDNKDNMMCCQMLRTSTHGYLKYLFESSVSEVLTFWFKMTSLFQVAHFHSNEFVSKLWCHIWLIGKKKLNPSITAVHSVQFACCSSQALTCFNDHFYSLKVSVMDTSDEYTGGILAFTSGTSINTFFLAMPCIQL